MNKLKFEPHLRKQLKSRPAVWLAVNWKHQIRKCQVCKVTEKVWRANNLTLLTEHFLSNWINNADQISIFVYCYSKAIIFLHSDRRLFLSESSVLAQKERKEFARANHMICGGLELKIGGKKKTKIFFFEGWFECAREKIKLACITSTAAEESEREKWTAAIKLKSYSKCSESGARNVQLTKVFCSSRKWSEQNQNDDLQRHFFFACLTCGRN